MTRQLDPTILRFFTVSRHISPASEMCLCKFHIKIENFLTRRHPPCAQTLSALRFLHRHSANTPPKSSKSIPSSTFPHHPPLLSTRVFKSQLFTVSHICVRIFCDFVTPPKRCQKPALSHTFLTPFCFVYFTTERWCPNPHLHYTFPLFPILFFLFTYTSMFCPIF